MSTPLLFLGGSARSGSTLLERMLAGIPGSCSVGELAFFWDRCVIRNDRCGCGARFHDCPFWQQVGKAAFGGWDQIDAAHAAQLHATLDRHRNLDRLSGLRSPGHLSATLDSYLGITDQLYAAIRDVSGASVIIDSSKQVGYALLLRDLPSVDLRLLHLVRRSHGVAYSWSKRVRATAVGDGTGLMSRHSPLWAVSLWMADNLLYDAIARQVPRATRVRYEDIVIDPRAALVRIAGDLDLPAADLSYLGDGVAELTTSHALSGNPMRFQQGRVVLRADEEWRSRMSRPRQAAISAATWPLLMRYGYWSASAPKQHP